MLLEKIEQALQSLTGKTVNNAVVKEICDIIRKEAVDEALRGIAATEAGQTELVARRWENALAINPKNPHLPEHSLLLSRIQEDISTWLCETSVVNTEDLVVTTVKIIREKAKTIYTYSDLALQQGLRICDQKLVFYIHAGVREYVGMFINPRTLGKDLVATLKVVDSEPGRAFLEAANQPGVNLTFKYTMDVLVDDTYPAIIEIKDILSIDVVRNN